MTEKEFLSQIWRPYDVITTGDGIRAKVLGVNFTTKSIRVLISGAGEWLHYELIEKHVTAKGAAGDESTLIEDLNTKISNQALVISNLKEMNQRMEEKLSRNYTRELLSAVNSLAQLVSVKKKWAENIELSLKSIEEAVNKMENQ